jgi:hypothetical protein
MHAKRKGGKKAHDSASELNVSEHLDETDVCEHHAVKLVVQITVQFDIPYPKCLGPKRIGFWNIHALHLYNAQKFIKSKYEKVIISFRMPLIAGHVTLTAFQVKIKLNTGSCMKNMGQGKGHINVGIAVMRNNRSG